MKGKNTIGKTKIVYILLKVSNILAKKSNIKLVCMVKKVKILSSTFGKNIMQIPMRRPLLHM